MSVQREGLLSLTRLLVGAHGGGTLSESMEIVAQTLGVEACAAYDADRDSLTLVAHRGLAPEVCEELRRLSRSEDPWFIAARAAKSRRVVAEAEVAASTSNATVAQGLARLAAVAVPLVAAREVLGVFVLLHRRAEVFDAPASSFLEAAAGVITLARKAERAEPPATQRREEAQMGPLAMAGMLAAHFADDIRGPLASMALVLREQDRTLSALTDPNVEPKAVVAPLRQLIQEAQLAVRRAQTVTDQIVSAAQATRREPLSLSAVLAEALHAVKPMAKSRGVNLVPQIEGAHRVLGRRSELMPAFVAMLTNAVNACEDGPHTRRPTVMLTMETDPRGVAVSIEDTGGGVPADLRARIFEPYFSTHDGAAGIGLTLAKHAIVSSSGHIELATSSALGGALFRVVLPLAAEARKERRTSLSSATLRKLAPRPSVLWIDRDAVFLSGARRALSAYEMRTAGTAADGERLLAEGPAPEIIFCELDLPDRSGLDLHAQIARRNQDLADRFVFVTDGVLSPERAAYVLGAGCPTLVKPMGLDEIRTFVQQASGERGEPSSRRSARTVPPPVDDPFDL
ncbi:MAG: hybrid sensor histidine kinase/response regulator [Polyangiaceae bacterium]